MIKHIMRWIYIYINDLYLSLSIYIYIHNYTHIFLHAFNYMETNGHVDYLRYLYVPLQWQVFLPNMVSAPAASGISPQRPMLAVEKICGAFSAARFTTNFCSLFGASRSQVFATSEAFSNCPFFSGTWLCQRTGTYAKMATFYWT